MPFYSVYIFPPVLCHPTRLRWSDSHLPIHHSPFYWAYIKIGHAVSSTYAFPFGQTTSKRHEADTMTFVFYFTFAFASFCFVFRERSFNWIDYAYGREMVSMVPVSGTIEMHGFCHIWVFRLENQQSISLCTNQSGKLPLRYANFRKLTSTIEIIYDWTMWNRFSVVNDKTFAVNLNCKRQQLGSLGIFLYKCVNCCRTHTTE